MSSKLKIQDFFSLHVLSVHLMNGVSVSDSECLSLVPFPDFMQNKNAKGYSRKDAEERNRRVNCDVIGCHEMVNNKKHLYMANCWSNFGSVIKSGPNGKAVERHYVNYILFLTHHQRTTIFLSPCFMLICQMD